MVQLDSFDYESQRNYKGSSRRAVSPDALGGTAVTLHLSTRTVDDDVSRAVSARATILRVPTDQGFGERTALLLDLFGHRWMLAQKIEDVTPEAMQTRWNAETGALPRMQSNPRRRPACLAG